MADTGPAAASPAAGRELVRFEVELEFVQCLANPQYLHHLAVQGPMDDSRFVKWLGYLWRTWSRPEYAKFITFPHALRYLQLLQQQRFREICKSAEFCQQMQRQQFGHWQYGRIKPYVDTTGRELGHAGAVPSLLDKAKQIGSDRL